MMKDNRVKSRKPSASQEADRILRLMAIGDKLADRLETAADGADAETDPLALQRLAAALKTLLDLAETGKEPAGDPGLTVTFEGGAGEAAE